jgi:membrane associated rhomboid family serine protease
MLIPLYDDNPTTRTPYVTVGLIVGCIVVFLWQVSLGPRGFVASLHSLGFIPAVLLVETVRLPAEIALVPAPATLVTYMFLHGSFFHLASNMLFLWIFGNNIEDACGHLRFLAFYLLCGLAAVGAQTVTDPASLIPMVGASGAVSGVLGAYLLLFPHARVYVLVLIFVYRLPAGFLLAFWFLMQLLSGATVDVSEGGVAFWAHVGGFVAGMGLIWLFRDRNFVNRAGRRGRSRIPPTWARTRRGPWG